MSKIPLPFVATTAIAAIVAVCLWQQLHGERQLTAQLRERIMQMEANQPRWPAMERQPVQLAGEVGISRNTEIGAVTTVKPSRSAPIGALDARELLKDREYRNALLAQMRATIPRNYPDLAKELGLASAQADALFDLLAKQQLDFVVRQNSADSSEIDKQEADQADREYALKQHAALEAQLGAEKYRQFREYGQTQYARVQVDEFRTALAATAYPLTEEQKGPLLVGLIDEQKRQIEEAHSRNRPAGDLRAQLEMQQESLKAREEGNIRVLETAQSYLSAQQVAVLRSSLDQRLIGNRLALRAQRAQLDGQAR